MLTEPSASQKPGTYKVVHSLNHSVREPVPDGYIYRINTGAPLPVGTDAVIMVEDTRLHSELAPGEQGQDGGEENEVTTLTMVDPGENVRSCGSDIEEGNIVMEKGDVIGNTGGDIGALAFVGCRMVSLPSLFLEFKNNYFIRSLYTGSQWSLS
jgi:gephyrin